MKHLRKFNESIDENELRDFCEINLAYLLDDGFEIMISGNNFSGDSFKSIKITNPSSLYDPEHSIYYNLGPVNFFKWNDIKDHFIPFCVRLEKEYEISEIKILGPTINLVIKDNFENRLDELSTEVVSYIDIYLSGEKSI